MPDIRLLVGSSKKIDKQFVRRYISCRGHFICMANGCSGASILTTVLLISLQPDSAMHQGSEASSCLGQTGMIIHRRISVFRTRFISGRKCASQW